MFVIPLVKYFDLEKRNGNSQSFECNNALFQHVNRQMSQFCIRFENFANWYWISRSLMCLASYQYLLQASDFKLSNGLF